MSASHIDDVLDVWMPIVHLPSATQFAVVAVTETSMLARRLQVYAKRKLVDITPWTAVPGLHPTR
jgi:hypothetical protein